MNADALRSICRAALDSGNLRAFLHVIRVGEGTADEDGYRRLFGGDLIEKLDDHPRIPVTRKLGGRPITSTAAGAYQFLSRTWDECRQALQIGDFGRDSQDLAAVFLIRRRGALDDAIAGRFEQAVAKCAREWASLPGSPYGQPTKTMPQALRTYTEAGGTFAPDLQPAAQAPDQVPAVPAPIPQPQPSTAMALPAFVLAALPALMRHVPELLRKFGDGTSVPERNMAAVQTAVEVAKSAIGARNEQELVTMLDDDPSAAKAVREAVVAAWGQIDEVGGGIAAAREANAAGSVLDPKRNLALWITLAILPLVYMVVAAVLWGTGWSQEVKAMVVASVVSGVLGAITGYWLGSSFGSARKDERTDVGPLNGGGPRPTR